MTLPKAVISDLDGTLAIHTDRDPYNTAECEKDAVNRGLLEIIKALRKTDTHIILVSGREDQFREHTTRWLVKHEIPHDWLYMRPTGDMRSDVIIKKEIYEAHIKGKYTVLGVFDDRKRIKRMWVENGIQVFDLNQTDVEF